MVQRPLRFLHIVVGHKGHAVCRRLHVIAMGVNEEQSSAKGRLQTSFMMTTTYKWKTYRNRLFHLKSVYLINIVSVCPSQVAYFKKFIIVQEIARVDAPHQLQSVLFGFERPLFS